MKSKRLKGSRLTLYLDDLRVIVAWFLPELNIKHLTRRLTISFIGIIKTFDILYLSFAVRGNVQKKEYI